MSTNSTSRTLVSFDYALKRLLRNKANYEVLEGFLSELLKRKIKVKDISESEGNKETRSDKSNKVDILVEDNTGEFMIIELQFTPEIDYFHRMLYGSSKVITERMFQGDKYRVVKKVYSINIVYFDLGKGEDYVYHGKTHFRGMHTGDELQLSPAQRKEFGKIEAGDIYPEYYILQVRHFNDVAKDTLDEWIYFLKNTEIKDGFKAQGLHKAREILDRDRLSPEERREYDRIVDMKSDDLSTVSSAKDEGFMEGEQKGILLGEQKGILLGEQKKEKQFILNSVRAGLPIATISVIAGLSEEEVQRIIQQG